MSEKLKISVFGQSHSEAIGVVIENFPAGMKVDKDALASFMARRAPGQKNTTPRTEKDEVHFVSGLNEQGLTCGAPICAIIYNTNVKSKDYEDIKRCPRPSHSDYVSYLKSGDGRDIRGGGQFSGRLTAPLCIAGGLCMQYLSSMGIKIGAHISQIGNVTDECYDKVNDQIPALCDFFPSLCENAGKLMQEQVEIARQNLDSVGAKIECKAIGIPAGYGDPMFDGIENQLARNVFAIPAVKGFEVGSGFGCVQMTGSQHNDPFRIVDGKVVTTTNNSGGINGGITNGMPLIFSVAFKPTPSILKEQQTVDLYTMQNATLTIKGRHDPCVGIRAVPVVEAVTAITLMQVLK